MRRKTKAKRVLDHENDEEEEDQNQDEIDVRTLHSEVLCVCNCASLLPFVVVALL